MTAIVFLLVAGALLMLLEPVFPHFVAGVVGLACWGGAVALTYVRYGVLAGHWTLVAALAVAIAGVWWYLHRLPETRIGQLVGSDRVTPAETASKAHLLNRAGVTLTPLRPGGMAEISGERVDVVTSGEPVERGQSITVVGVEGARVLVRAVS